MARQSIGVDRQEAGWGWRATWSVIGIAGLALVIGACSSAGVADQDSRDGGWIGDVARGSSISAGESAAPAEAVQQDAAAAQGVSAAAVAPAPPATGGGEQQSIAIQESTAPQVGNVPPSTGARHIIKDADLSILVADVPIGIGRIETVAAQSGGYVIETATDYRDRANRTAMVKLGVPVNTFEAALERIRQAALEVVSESATGSDVSGEVVDLRAQIANLEATTARVRSFLDQATTVEEALQVNAQLTRLEGDIAERMGRLEYLEQRAAFSTITVSLTEPTPDWTPTVTPTPPPTETPMPTATPVPWQPGETVRDATNTVQGMLRGLVELMIWLVIVGLPFALIMGAVITAVVWVMRRFGPPPSGS